MRSDIICYAFPTKGDRSRITTPVATIALSGTANTTAIMISYFINASMQRECENKRFEYERKIKEEQLAMGRETRRIEMKTFLSRAKEDKKGTRDEVGTQTIG